MSVTFEEESGKGKEKMVREQVGRGRKYVFNIDGVYQLTAH